MGISWLVVAAMLVGTASATPDAPNGGVTSAAHPDRPGCDTVARAVGSLANQASCVESADLTTNNEASTPPDNSRRGLPVLAFTPRTDREAVAGAASDRYLPTRKVPGLQITGALAGDRDAHFVLRLPDRWNGRLVTGAPSAFRSEYGLDYAFSDYVLERGYAYVATNKGLLSARPSTPADPRACAGAPAGAAQSAVHVHAYLLDPENSFGEWAHRTVQGAEVARALVAARYGRLPERNYAVGISAGGWTVRMVLERMPGLFDGGLDWEGATFRPGAGLPFDLPTALRHWPGYRAAGFDAGSPAAHALREHGFPADVRTGPSVSNLASPIAGSYLETHANTYWHLLGCVVQKKIDPSYRGELAAYDFPTRDRALDLTEAHRDAWTTGKLRRPLLSIAGTADALTPVQTHQRPYADLVQAAGRAGLHRSYEVQNGTHADRLAGPAGTFPMLTLVQPHALRAFELLVQWVEHARPAPRSQCVPIGETIERDTISRPVRCAELVQ